MLPFKTLLDLNEKAPQAIFRQLAAQLLKLIQQGMLAPGMPLPSSRAMAELLGLHRKTVMAAYAELLTQDWIESLPRRGYRISSNLPAVKPRTYTGRQAISPFKENAQFAFGSIAIGNPPAPIPDSLAAIFVNDGFPDTALAPIGKIQKEYQRLMEPNQLKKILDARDYGGTPVLKAAASTFLNGSRGLNSTTDNLMITRGAQMAIYLAASLLIRPGDKVIVSDPSYFIADAVFRQLGAQLIRVAVDQEGMNVDQIETILNNHKIRFLYVIPHHHHPTTVTMTANRRLQLLELIKRHQLVVIEDDYDYDFHYDNSPYLPLASSDHEGNVIYIGSFTKLLAPSFRLGYLIAAPDFVREAIKLKRLIDLRGDAVMEGAMARLIENGDLSRHIKKSNKLYSARCDNAAKLMEAELGDVLDFTKPQGGMALWLRFKPHHPLGQIIKKSAVMGLQLYGAAYYDGPDQKHNGMRFGFASLDNKTLEAAVSILAKASR